MAAIKITELKQFLRHNAVHPSLLAERIGMDKSLLSQYMEGTKTPSTAQLLRIQLGIQELGKAIQEAIKAGLA